jgi:PAS domain S-box-containing protein
MIWTLLKQRVWRWRGVFITTLSVAGIVIALRLAGVLQLAELITLDQFFHLRPSEAADSRIVLVTIDEPDIQQLGQWPMSDAVLAQLIDKLKQQHPRAIGLDLYRNLPVEPGHQALVKVFASTPNLIGIKKVVRNVDGTAVDAPPELDHLGQVSASDFVLDIDSRLRRNLLYLRDRDDGTILSLGAKLAFLYLSAEGITPKTVDPQQQRFQLGQAIFSPIQSHEGGYVRIDAGGYQILSNFRRLRQGFHRISMTDVLEGRMPPKLIRENGNAPLRDRIVLIGIEAESLKDNFYTSVTPSGVTLAGVEVHAQLASQLMSAALDGRPLLRAWSEPLEWLWIVVWSGVGATLGWTLRSPQRTIVQVLLYSIAVLGSAYLLFLVGWWVIVIPPLCALVGAALVGSGWLLWQNLKISHRQLQLSHKQLEEYAQTLEQRVEARTSELAQEKELLQTIIDHIPEMILLYDAMGQIQFVNHELKEVLGWSQSERLSDQIVNSVSASVVRQQFLEHLLDVTGEWLDLTITTKAGQPLETSWAAIQLSKHLRIGIGQDISDRKRAEVASVLNERNRIAREIHDTLAQTFGGILLHVGAATGLMKNDPNSALPYIATIDELARTGLAEARRSVAALRPKLLEEGDLCGALYSLVAQMNSANPQIICEIVGTVYPLSPNIEDNFLRIAQEALVNAIKHAHASEVRILLVYETAHTILRIKDNGRGFEMNAQVLKKGFGLLGMSERTERIGGEFTIHSQLGWGTEVVVVVKRKL